MNIEKIFLKKNVDGILVTNYYNLRYFTGFTGSNGAAVILKNGGKFFITDFRYFEQADIEVKPNGYKVVKMTKDINESIKTIIEDENIRYLGIEDKDLNLNRYNILKEKLTNIDFVMLQDDLIKCRMIKSNEEIANIKKAVEIADNSYKEIIKKIKDGITEKELANELEYIMKKNGADERSFDTIVASGSRSAMPHGVASNKIIEKENYLLFDFGAYYNGYVSDMTRTVYFGKNPTKRHIELYNIVKEAQEIGIKNARAGIKSSQLDKIVRDFIKSKGYGDKFGHGLGHGIGLEIHELPTVSYRSDIILEENMVLTIEPGIYIEGFGGVRIEDDVIIKKSGCEVLNKFSKELILI